MIAYELLTGSFPFDGPDYGQQHIADQVEPIPGVPLKLASLVEECLYKSPQARPLAQNLLARLQSSGAEASPAALQLQAANALVVQQIAEERRAESIARAEAERRQLLYEDAHQSLERALDALRRQIEDNASTVQFEENPSRKIWRLNQGTLEVDEIRDVADPTDGISIDVIAFASIRVYSSRHGDGYRGREHSLWYCDAQFSQVFRWYETGFFHAEMSHVQGFQPFSLLPHSDHAAGALSSRRDSLRVARPFTAIDQGDEEDFTERWIGYFAQAARAGLSPPKQMPESDPRGSWRLPT